jgi:hypothetical protein
MVYKLYLQMWIGRTMVARREIEYDGMQSVEERQDHQEKIASEMRNKYSLMIYNSNEEPQFFIDNVPSKMNEQ